jgi:hypothetical protein
MSYGGPVVASNPIRPATRIGARSRRYRADHGSYGMIANTAQNNQSAA